MIRMVSRLAHSRVVLLSTFVSIASLNPCIRASTLDVNGGRLESAGLLEAYEIHVGPGTTLTASGRVAADITVHGTLAHQELAVDGALDFAAGSVWIARVLDASTADVLAVTGRVTGRATVRVVAPTNAVPVGLVLLDAHPSSRLENFNPELPTIWTLDEPAPGRLALTRPAGDSDGDSLPDAWELEHFFNRTSAEALGDGDADGFVNLAEYRAGTLPSDPSSVLRIGDLSHDGDIWRLAWPSVAGRTYRVLTASGIDGAFTNLVEEVTATPPTNLIIRTLPEAFPLLLRVELSP
jgi:hypothetical protein